MTRLAVSLDFMEEESLTSFCSRLAAANNVSRSRAFAQHMGMSYQDVALGATRAVGDLARLSGMDISRLRRGTATRVDNQFQINGEILTDTFYNRSMFRFCPHCLREDVERGLGPRASRPFGRIAWTVGFIRTCPIHGVFLATLPRTIDIGLRDDFSAIWRETAEDDRTVHCPAGEHSQFERYVLRRLQGDAPIEEWIDGLELYVVGHMSETIGAAINQGKNFRATQLDPAAWHAAGETGFQVLRKGRDAVVEFLKTQQDDFLARKRNHYSGQALYGTLFRRLEALMADVNYDPVRDLIREHAIRTLPFGPDDLLFRRLAMPRQLHSIKTASDETGLGVKLLQSRLLHNGIISSDALRTTPHRIFFKVDSLRRMLEEMTAQEADGILKATVEEKEGGTILGVSRESWNHIVRAFDLRDRAYARVSRRRVETFLEDLKLVARENTAASLDGLHDPAAAALACSCTISEILQLVLSRKLRTVGLDDERDGIAQILVDKTEVWTAIHDARMQGHLTSFEAADLLFIDVDSLAKLARSGVLPRTNMPGMGRQFFYLKDLVDDFNSAYASTARIAAAAGLSSAKAAALLHEHAVEPSFIKTERAAHLYPLTRLRGVFDTAVVSRLAAGCVGDR
ncbi:TniQ family protein [Rhizobium leguminosarum]